MIQFSSLIMILFQATASYSSFLFDQVNPGFIYFFLHISRRICSLVSTDTKLDKSQLLNTCLAIFFVWTFAVLINTNLCYSFQGCPHLGLSETLPVSWNFARVSKMQLLKISSCLAIFRWLIFLAIFTIFILISFEKIFPIF